MFSTCTRNQSLIRTKLPIDPRDPRGKQDVYVSSKRNERFGSYNVTQSSENLREPWKSNHTAESVN